MRLLPPEKYDDVIKRMQAANRTNDPYVSMLKPQAASAMPAKTAKPAKPAMGSMDKMSMLLAFALLGAMLADAQESMLGMTMPKTPPSQSTRDTQTLQEPEDPSHTTGANLPAPDLLEGVAARPAIALQTFLDAAEKTSPNLALARDQARRTQAQAQQAALYPNPTIGYQGEQIRGGSYGGGEQGGYIGQTIAPGGKLALRRGVFERQQQVDATPLDEEALALQNDISQAFNTALTAQAKVVLRQRLAGLAADAVETVHQLANVGQADAPDILETEVESEQAKIDDVTAQHDFIASFRALATQAGKPSLPLSPLAGEIETPPQLDTEAQVRKVIAESPTLKRMQQQVAVAEARLKAAQHESIPDLELKAGEQYNNERLGATGAPAKAAGPQSFASAGITLPLRIGTRATSRPRAPRSTARGTNFLPRSLVCRRPRSRWRRLI